MEKTSIFNEDQSFQNLVKEAKQKSIKRIILVSISVFIIIVLILWGLIALGQYYMYKEMEKQTTQDFLDKTFTGANIQANGTNYDYFLLAATTKSKMFKDINGHQIQWGTMEHFYTILGTKTYVENNNYINGYNNNQRVLQFYPYTEPKIENDLPYLKKLPSFYSVEVAVSFTKDLTLEEMAVQFPTAQWAWIIQDGLFESIAENKEAEKDFPSISPKNSGLVDGDSAYGFQIKPKDQFQSAQNFLDQIDIYAHDEQEALAIIREKIEKRGEDPTGLHFPGHQKIYEAEILKKTIGNADPHSLKVSGAVLTGSIEEVLPYLENNLIHYISVGVILPY
ncbi:anti sigma factor C-terminal domain-containing protein [Lysinibacillus sp. NPDC097231]|uniref:anti sigma factor C-terminal domain-containing protein n=1 Tax=Lysinibacillus sp. NPDC097231 TaxID=3364142 RepID=UPI003811BC84